MSQPDQSSINPDEILTLERYAQLVDKSPRSVQRDVKLGKIVAWTDPFTKKRVTSMASIERVRRAAQAAAEAELIQKSALSYR